MYLELNGVFGKKEEKTLLKRTSPKSCQVEGDDLVNDMFSNFFSVAAVWQTVEDHLSPFIRMCQLK